MRIDKMLSQLNYGSRQEIKKMAKKGLIICNDIPVNQTSLHIDPEIDHIVVNHEPVIYLKQFILKLYKPSGYVCGKTDALYPSVIDLIGMPYQRYALKIAGRLDVDVEGLLLITNDGMIQHDITHPKKHLKKHYEVTLDQTFTHQSEIMAGVAIKDGHNQPFIAKALSIESYENHVKIIIDEGKFHQVKRMFQALNYQVTHLKRTHIGFISLGDLKPGSYIEVSMEAYNDRTHYESL